MLKRYSELADMPEEERRSHMLAMADVEYELSDAKLRIISISRLQVWLKMDPEVAERVCNSYDSVMKKPTAQKAMRQVSVASTLARFFSPEDKKRLLSVFPDVFGPPIQTLPADEVPPVASSKPAKKGWWPFRGR